MTDFTKSFKNAHPYIPGDVFLSTNKAAFQIPDHVLVGQQQNLFPEQNDLL